MRMGIVTFSVGSRTYKFKKPLMLGSEFAGGLLFLTHKELSLSAPGKSFGGCEQTIREELAMLWEEYAMAPDKELSANAIILKNNLLGWSRGEIMIFAVEGHIEMIWNGVFFKTQKMEGINLPIVKTQTRRLNRGIYQVGRDYAVQRKRGVKAEPDLRIVMDRIWKEDCIADELAQGGYFLSAPISEADAWAEGGYMPEEFEKLFREINPNWNGITRYGFKFHVIEIKQ